MEKGLIIDASAILAIYLEEPPAKQVSKTLNNNPVRLMSAVTATEVLIQLFYRRLASREDFYRDMQERDVQFIDVDMNQAVIAAEVRGRYPLNIGDCFVYALAKTTGCTIVTLDSDFRNCDLPVILLDW